MSFSATTTIATNFINNIRGESQATDRFAFFKPVVCSSVSLNLEMRQRGGLERGAPFEGGLAPWRVTVPSHLRRKSLPFSKHVSTLPIFQAGKVILNKKCCSCFQVICGYFCDPWAEGVGWGGSVV